MIDWMKTDQTLRTGCSELDLCPLRPLLRPPRRILVLVGVPGTTPFPFLGTEEHGDEGCRLAPVLTPTGDIPDTSEVRPSSTFQGLGASDRDDGLRPRSVDWADRSHKSKHFPRLLSRSRVSTTEVGTESHSTSTSGEYALELLYRSIQIVVKTLLLRGEGTTDTPRTHTGRTSALLSTLGRANPSLPPCPSVLRNTRGQLPRSGPTYRSSRRK